MTQRDGLEIDRNTAELDLMPSSKNTRMCLLFLFEPARDQVNFVTENISKGCFKFFRFMLRVISLD